MCRERYKYCKIWQGNMLEKVNLSIERKTIIESMVSLGNPTNMIICKGMEKTKAY